MTQVLLSDIDAFLEGHQISPVSFGRQAMKDPHFVRDLRNGRRVWPETEARVRKFMSEHRAAEADATAICAHCEISSEDHRVRSCASAQCPLRARNAA